MMDIGKLAERLTEIYEGLKKDYPAFPNGLCAVASERVAKSLDIEVESGYFITDLPTTFGRQKLYWNVHSWNYSQADNLTIDITILQFWNRVNVALPPTLIAPCNSRIVTERYRRHGLRRSKFRHMYKQCLYFFSNAAQKQKFYKSRRFFS